MASARWGAAMRQLTPSLLIALTLAACARPSADPRPIDASPPIVAAAVTSSPPAKTASTAREDAGPAPSASATASTEPDAGAPIVVDVGMIDAAAHGAISRGEVPGVVVAVVHGGRVTLQKAYGLRSKEPDERPMTVDTVFDLASLTKVVATAPSVMLLVEQGKIRLGDPVARYLPSFAKNGKERVTVEQLLLHTSGLVADNALADYRAGRAAALASIDALPLMSQPGERTTYSDVGFIVLAEIVERVSGQPLDTFARERFYAPLGMRDTGFVPSAALSGRAAPTEKRDGVMLRGQVHDPRAHLLGGVAGHAGLFSTAPDLARFVGLLLARGEHEGRAILAPATVARMTAPHELPNGARRTLGWDVRPGFLGGTGFGHTGFTGTSLWIDPGTDTAIVLLTSRLHPDGKGDVSRLRREVAGAVARARVGPSPSAAPVAPAAKAGAVRVGIDVLEAEGFARLRGRKIGLITNQTGIDHAGRSTVDVLRGASGVTLVALFTPEHGLRGAADGRVSDGLDPKTRLPVYSLYGARMKPTAAQLAGIDTLVFDLQDIGARFYTFATTLGYALEAAAEHRLRVVVLDRPNPVGGLSVEGPVLEAGRSSFTEYHPVPLRHGMTIGELGTLFNAERKIGADLQVVKIEGWRREHTFDRTGLGWVSPSPSMRRLDEALLYPGIALLDGTNVSVGRGTDRPFEQVGAPFVDGVRLAHDLTLLRLPGVRFAPVSFTPVSGAHVGERCEGVFIGVVDRSGIEPVRIGLAVAQQLARQHPGEVQLSAMRRMIGHEPTYAAVTRGDPIDDIVKSWESDLAAFAAVRKRHLLYPP